MNSIERNAHDYTITILLLRSMFISMIPFSITGLVTYVYIHLIIDSSGESEYIHSFHGFMMNAIEYQTYIMLSSALLAISAVLISIKYYPALKRRAIEQYTSCELPIAMKTYIKSEICASSWIIVFMVIVILTLIGYQVSKPFPENLIVNNSLFSLSNEEINTSNELVKALDTLNKMVTYFTSFIGCILFLSITNHYRRIKRFSTGD